jgi:YbbR domain-containing protein
MARDGSIAKHVRAAFVDNLGLKFIALVLALTVFILVNSDEDAVAGAYVRVAYTLPDDRVLVSDRVDQVRITVKGSERRIRRFDEDALATVQVDLRRLDSGDLVFRHDMFRLPPGLRLSSVDPPALPVRFEPLARKQVALVGATRGESAHGFGVAAVVATRTGCAAGCDRVEIEGAESYVARIEEVRTEDVPLAGHGASFSAEVGVVPPGRFVAVVGDPRVRVDVTLVEELTTRALPGLAVALRPGAGAAGLNLQQFSATPAAVDVVLRGARLAVEPVVGADVKVYVDVHASDLAGAQQRRAAVLVDGVPTGVAVETTPRDVILSRAPR